MSEVLMENVRLQLAQQLPFYLPAIIQGVWRMVMV